MVCFVIEMKEIKHVGAIVENSTEKIFRIVFKERKFQSHFLFMCVYFGKRMCNLLVIDYLGQSYSIKFKTFEGFLGSDMRMKKQQQQQQPQH
ncbi:CLUMA_CG010181, isoform A [Clunio marinus]|uniref:CLUMA_CG010181, isoform A n=1 Tax=Clunio marinus TaxID=568069 RepID=A0A1J1IAB4_9DIPT|nr:CLUMA_CG010181, isoform A [Clunio marinus]